MKRKGILIGYCMLAALTWMAPISAEENSDDITAMLTWWDEFGSDWEEAKELIDFVAMDTTPYLVADNTMEMQDGKRRQ
ncbi:hypothetical protein VSS37_10780 [Candidatus Thiothrix sp. Deng01]|uniref:Uncharacterized protein n=1 Tax=Candidatus Thiothrix phosphatis TaxID=3112415 RepID=A0ABU6CXB3_9GAMM|nr:hypothetical protein [Candidatus Thiothrix sp. Deng01]MEB4591465.1 hypothetical protein [Candidatus Thiothrix sp. Deng01]